jgi:hypothetical protein
MEPLRSDNEIYTGGGLDQPPEHVKENKRKNGSGGKVRSEMNWQRFLIITTIVGMIYGSTALVLGVGSAAAQESDEELAKKLSNPIAALISVPFEFNYNKGYGTEEGEQFALNIMPVIPITLNKDWNVISRTIVPVILQDDIAGRSGEQAGLGDTLQSLFFSPSKPIETGIGNLTWGAGPAIAIPTGTDDLLGSGKFGLGPTGVTLIQKGPWTYGALVNHIWSVAGEGNRDEVSATFMQPFIAYTTPTAWTFIVQTESTYDWKTEQWSVPINASISKLVTIGSQKVQFQVGSRYWAESPSGGPEDIGATFKTTFLFPK